MGSKKYENKLNIKVLTSVILVLLILTMGFYIIVPIAIIQIRNPLTNLIKPISKPKILQTGETVRIKSTDGFVLIGKFCNSKNPNSKGTIILLHGIRASKEHFDELSIKLNKEGYNTLAIDLRAHGESGGRYCTFGFYEKNDISKFVDYLITVKNETNLIIWGQSLGAAISLQTMSIDKRIKIGIIESTFSELNSVFVDYVTDYTGIELSNISHTLLERASEIGQFKVERVKPIEDCKKIDKPILMVHGDDDQKIDIKYGINNYINLRSRNKKFITVKDAGHLDVWEKGGDDLYKRIVEFINNQSKLIHEVDKNKKLF